MRLLLALLILVPALGVWFVRRHRSNRRRAEAIERSRARLKADWQKWLDTRNSEPGRS